MGGMGQEDFPSWDIDYCPQKHECYSTVMSVTQVIEAIKHLPPNDQAEVIQFAFQLASTRPLTSRELTTLAQRMADTENPAEAERLKTSIVQGFCGN